MKLDLNKLPVDLDSSTPFKDTLAKILADWLKSSPKGDALKFLDWAMSLFREGSLTLSSQVDYEELYNFVSTVPAWAMLRGQIQREMKNQRESQSAFK